jgi:hypothetical protein
MKKEQTKSEREEKEIKEIVEKISKKSIDTISFNKLEEKFRNNEKISLEAAKKNPKIIPFLSPSFLENKDFILKIVPYCKKVLQFTSEALKNDQEVVMLSTQSHPNSFNYSSLELKDDEHFMLKCYNRNTFLILEFASPRIKKNEEIMLKFIKKSPLGMSFVPNTLLQSGDFMLKCLKYIPESFSFSFASKFIPKELKGNRDFALQAVKIDGLIIGFLDPKFKKDEELYLEALKQNGSSIRYLSDELKNNSSIGMLAVDRSPISYLYLSNKLQLNRKIILKALEKNGTILFSIPDPTLKNDVELILKAIQHDGKRVIEDYRGTIFRSNGILMTEVVKSNPECLMLASATLRNNKRFLKFAVEISPNSLKYASKELKSDVELVMLAISQDGTSIQFADWELRGDRNLATLAVENNANAIVHLFGDLQLDKELNMKAVKKDYSVFSNLGEIRSDMEIVWISKRYFKLVRNIPVHNIKFQFL